MAGKEEKDAELVTVTSVECSGVRDLQRVLIPAGLLLRLGGRPGGHLRLQLTPRTAVICRAAPVVDCCGDYGQQIVVCGCVEEGVRVLGVYNVTPADITPLEVVAAAMVEVTVVVGGVKDVLSYRKNKSAFTASLHSLLALYVLTPDAQIDCRRNPLAGLLGITLIEVQGCEGVGVGQAGAVGPETRVEVAAVESEDRRRLAVRCQAELGGLDNILAHLRRLVAEPWARREEFGRVGVVYPSGEGVAETILVHSPSSNLCLVYFMYFFIFVVLSFLLYLLCLCLSFTHLLLQFLSLSFLSFFLSSKTLAPFFFFLDVS